IGTRVYLYIGEALPLCAIVRLPQIDLAATASSTTARISATVVKYRQLQWS
ncbi:hypothetical protein J6590_042976, partial [Homalodisca vitripennis]